MTKKFNSLLAAIACLLALNVHAVSFTNTPNAAIPDANPTGLTSTIEVTNLSGLIQGVTVTLDITNGFNGDLYAYLEHGTNGFAVLLNRVGRMISDPLGYADPGFFVTFVDSALNDIHNYGGNGGAPLTGTWSPDGRDVDPLTVLNTDPRTALLSSFANDSANGTWTIFVADFTSGHQSVLREWSLDIIVPEPSTGALAACGIVAWFVRRRLR
jgi:subtilisin-like proprotein convertase family protein